MKIKKNDTVVVLTGKDVKKVGKVLVAYPKTNKIVVEGVNVQEKNRKARSAQETSTKIKKEGPIDASNVLVICATCGKATRVGYSEVEGKKVRTCKKCGASLDVKPAKVEAPKKARRTKKAEVATEAVAETEVQEVKKTTRRRKKAETAETEA
ncbi:MAG: 50S ribosomal protein L24 [Clostridia bacterium]|nr:50S ribosomal protein L24 [Clostridia bacterium]